MVPTCSAARRFPHGIRTTMVPMDAGSAAAVGSPMDVTAAAMALDAATACIAAAVAFLARPNVRPNVGPTAICAS